MIDGFGNALRFGRAIAEDRAGSIIGRRGLGTAAAKSSANCDAERGDDACSDCPCRNIERERQRANGVDHGFNRLDARRDDRVALFDAGSCGVGHCHGRIRSDLGSGLRADQADLYRRILDGDRQFKGAKHLFSGCHGFEAIRTLLKEPLRGRSEVAIMLDLSRSLRRARVRVLEGGPSIFTLCIGDAASSGHLRRGKTGDLDGDAANRPAN